MERKNVHTVEVSKLLEDSCKNKHVKSGMLGASLSSGLVLVWANKNFVFWIKRCEHVVGARKLCGNQSDFI